MGTAKCFHTRGRDSELFGFRLRTAWRPLSRGVSWIGPRRTDAPPRYRPGRTQVGGMSRSGATSASRARARSKSSWRASRTEVVRTISRPTSSVKAAPGFDFLFMACAQLANAARWATSARTTSRSRSSSSSIGSTSRRVDTNVGQALVNLPESTRELPDRRLQCDRVRALRRSAHGVAKFKTLDCRPGSEGVLSARGGAIVREPLDRDLAADAGPDHRLARLRVRKVLALAQVFLRPRIEIDSHRQDF